MTAPLFTPRWTRREPPLPAAAVAVCGAAVSGMWTAVGERVADGARLRAAAGPRWLVVLGEAGDLPWVDGARYLGWDAGLLVPTTLLPWPAADLLRAALHRAAPHSGLFALLPGQALAAPLPVRPLDPPPPAAGPMTRPREGTSPHGTAWSGTADRSEVGP